MCRPTAVALYTCSFNVRSSVAVVLAFNPCLLCKACEGHSRRFKLCTDFIVKTGYFDSVLVCPITTLSVFIYLRLCELSGSATF
jgi:hypothetical protein